MNIQNILEQIAQDPQVSQVVDDMAAELVEENIPESELQELAQIIQQTIDDPESWPQVRQELIESGAAEEEDLPEEFHSGFMYSFLAAVMEVLKRMQSQSYAKGGLVKYTLAQAREKLQDGGRNGDTILAHINPREASTLRRMGGSGTINPNTGLREFGLFSGLKKIVKKVAPIAAIAATVFMPALAPAIGGALGLSGTAAAIAGGAILSGGAAAISGGNILRGALIGGAAAGLGSAFGGGAAAAEGASGAAGAAGAAEGAASAAGAAGGTGSALSGIGDVVSSAGDLSLAAGAAPESFLSAGDALSAAGDLSSAVGGAGEAFAGVAPEALASASDLSLAAAPNVAEAAGAYYPAGDAYFPGALERSGVLGDAAASGTQIGNVNLPSTSDTLAHVNLPKVATQAAEKGTLEQLKDFALSPKGLVSLGTAAVGAYDAKRRNDLMEQAMAQQQNELAARKAEQAKYNNPVRYAFERQLTAPAARRGASQFFTNNALPSTPMASGGLVQAFAGGGLSSGDSQVSRLFRRVMAGRDGASVGVAQPQQAAAAPAEAAPFGNSQAGRIFNRLATQAGMYGPDKGRGGASIGVADPAAGAAAFTPNVDPGLPQATSTPIGRVFGYNFNRQMAPVARRGAMNFFRNNALRNPVAAAEGGLVQAFAEGGSALRAIRGGATRPTDGGDGTYTIRNYDPISDSGYLPSGGSEPTSRPAGMFGSRWFSSDPSMRNYRANAAELNAATMAARYPTLAAAPATAAAAAPAAGNTFGYNFNRQLAPTARRGATNFFRNNAIRQVAAAEGGLMQAFEHGGYMRGGTSGQSDQVNARLSDGEFVVPADVVAHLGDGNNEAGANKLHGMMENVRKQKTAKRTGLPSKAKPPTKYMKGK